VFLTSAQTILAVAILADRRVTIFEAILLFSLFVAQFFFRSPDARQIFGILYLIWAFIIFYKQMREGGYRWIGAIFRLRRMKEARTEEDGPVTKISAAHGEA
jgi:hypothetical protein